MQNHGRNPVVVTYRDEYGVWKHVESDIRNRLPLRNLPWKSAQRGLKTVPVLDIELKKFGTDVFPKGTMFQFKPTPFLHMYFVNCDDTDTYRQVVRKQIKEWLDTVTSKKNQEWLIVYVSSQDNSRNPAKFLMKGGVYEKIKSDFNTGKKDRCTQLRLHDTEAKDQDVWGDFFFKIKEGILCSFDLHVSQYEDDIRRLDAQRMMPGWNYCQFFMIKEGLASCFDMMTLYEDALVQYDELEASFFQTIDSQATSFSSFGATDPRDDSADLLDLEKKPYTDLLLQNLISIFDFRCYLFARQCQLLTKLRRPVEICYRARGFLVHLSKSLEYYQEQTIPFFRESWMYSSCLSIVNHCDDLVSSTKPDAAVLEPYESMKAELLYSARQQLDRLGLALSYLDSSITHVITPPKQSISAEGIKFTNVELKSACQSVEAFDELYIRTTYQTIRAFESSGRARTVLLLQSDIASIYYNRKRYLDAVEILEKICKHYYDNGWQTITNSVLVKLVQCQKQLQLAKPFASNLLKLLATGISSGQQIELEEYAQELRGVSNKLDEEIVAEINPFFQIHVSTKLLVSQKAESLSDLYTKLNVTNQLNCDIEVDQVSLLLVGGDLSDIWFNSKPTKLKAGRNTVKLNWEKPSTAGNYIAEKVRIRIGKVVFMQNLLTESNKKHVFRIHEPYTTVRLQVGLPRIVYPTSSLSHILLRIRTFDDIIQKGTIMIKSLSQGCGIDLSPSSADVSGEQKVQGKKLSDNQDMELEISSNSKIVLPSCGKNETLEILVPIKLEESIIEGKVRTVLEYTNEDNIVRVVSALERIKRWNPLSLRHFVYHNENGIYLQLIVRNEDLIPVRLSEIYIDDSKVLDIQNLWNQKQISDSVLFHEQTCSIVHKLKRKELIGDVDHTEIRVNVKHHYINEEIESYFLHNLHSNLHSRQLGHFYLLLRRLLKGHLKDSFDYAAYVVNESEKLGMLDEKLWENELVHEETQVRKELIEFGKWFFEVRSPLRLITLSCIVSRVDVGIDRITKLQEFQEITTGKVSSLCNVYPRTMVFTPELFLPNISISVSLQPTKQSLTVGEACLCAIHVVCKKFWEAVSNSDQTVGAAELELYYDVEVDFENWMMNGQKRKRFKAKVNEKISFPIHLVPLKPGYLPLPAVQIHSSSALNNALSSSCSLDEYPVSRDDNFFVSLLSKSVQVLVLPETTNGFAISGLTVRELVGYSMAGRSPRKGANAGGGKVGTGMRGRTSSVIDLEMDRFSDFAVQL